MCGNAHTQTHNDKLTTRAIKSRCCYSILLCGAQFWTTFNGKRLSRSSCSRRRLLLLLAHGFHWPRQTVAVKLQDADEGTKEVCSLRKMWWKLRMRSQFHETNSILIDPSSRRQPPLHRLKFTILCCCCCCCSSQRRIDSSNYFGYRKRERELGIIKNRKKVEGKGSVDEEEEEEMR